MIGFTRPYRLTCDNSIASQIDLQPASDKRICEISADKIICFTKSDLITGLKGRVFANKTHLLTVAPLSVHQ